MCEDRDKHKDNEIVIENSGILKSVQGVWQMTEKDLELLNDIYRDISDALGMEIACGIHRLLKGQQVCFPMHFFNPSRVYKLVVSEYDGTNIKQLAMRYDYSEKTIRRILRTEKLRKKKQDDVDKT